MGMSATSTIKLHFGYLTGERKKVGCNAHNKTFSFETQLR